MRSRVQSGSEGDFSQGFIQDHEGDQGFSQDLSEIKGSVRI